MSAHPVVRCWIDLETTGLSAYKSGICQLAVIMEKDGAIEEWQTLVQPDKTCRIEQKALDVSGITLEQIREAPHERDVKKQFEELLGRYVSKYDKQSKAFFCGYNATFDSQFVRNWFERCFDDYFGSLFWSGTIDVMSLALDSLQETRWEMPDFKLGTVAKTILGQESFDWLGGVDGLHDAMTDIRLTREMYRVIKGYPGLC